jgi:hypothetical protein
MGNVRGSLIARNKENIGMILEAIPDPAPPGNAAS